MRLQYLRMASLALTMVMALSACGGSAGSSGGSSAKDADQLLKDAVDLELAETAEQTFTKEYDGYSCDVTVKTWEGMRGDAAMVLHPVNAEIAIANRETTELLIPFTIEVKCTTPDSSFSTDVRMVYDVIWGTDHNVSSSQCHALVTDEQILSESKDKWNYMAENDDSLPETTFYARNGSWPIWNMYATLDSSGITMQQDEVYTIYGYMVVPSYYSPANPDGDASLLPDTFGLALDVGLATDHSYLGYIGGTAPIVEEEARTGEPYLADYDCFVPFVVK